MSEARSNGAFGTLGRTAVATVGAVGSAALVLGEVECPAATSPFTCLPMLDIVDKAFICMDTHRGHNERDMSAIVVQMCHRLMRATSAPTDESALEMITEAIYTTHELAGR